MKMLAKVPVMIARHLPAPLKKAIHGNRWVGQSSLAVYGALLGRSVLTIEHGPMQGLKLSPSRHISHAHIYGDYELDTQQAIDRAMRPGDVCYDLGASIGYMSLLMSRKARRVYAFEPSPHAAEELRRQMAANGLDTITIVPSPVSDCVREVRFCITDEAYGAAINESETRWPVLNLQTTTLDDFARTHEPPDFMKIDVEGEEGRVLRGGIGLLERHRPAICCELHSRECAREVADVLLGLGYGLETLSGEPFVVPTDVIPGEVHVIARHPGRP